MGRFLDDTDDDDEQHDDDAELKLFGWHIHQYMHWWKLVRI